MLFFASILASMANLWMSVKSNWREVGEETNEFFLKQAKLDLYHMLNERKKRDEVLPQIPLLQKLDLNETSVWSEIHIALYEIKQHSNVTDSDISTLRIFIWE